jgi:YesN/AraC family two-component response regulator
LSSIFKAEVGVTISGYIRNKKLDEAKYLLQLTSYSVTEIGEMLGFCDIAYFSNQFKSKFGKSPKKLLRESIN